MDSPWVVGTRGLQVSRSSTALVFAFKLSRVLLASLRASEGAISIGWLRRRRHSGQAQALVAGGRLNLAWTGNLQQPPCPGSSAVVIPWYTVATVMLNFVGNWRCSRALDWSAVAACLAKAGFLVKKAIITHFYNIITSLLPVITIMMALLLHIFASLLRHCYILIRLLLHHYYLLLV